MSDSFNREVLRVALPGFRIIYESGPSAVCSWGTDDDSTIRRELVNQCRRIAARTIADWQQAEQEHGELLGALSVNAWRDANDYTTDAAIMVAYGGPTITLHVKDEEVVGTQGEDMVTVPVTDDETLAWLLEVANRNGE